MGDGHERPYVNFIIEDEAGKDKKLISSTAKVRKVDGYTFAVRRGRGEPDLNDPNNNDPWVRSKFINESIPGEDTGTIELGYSEDVIGVNKEQFLGIEILRAAAHNLYGKQHLGDSMLTVVLYVIEPARLKVFGDYLLAAFREAEDGYPYITFEKRHKILIKNWGNVSDALRKAHGGEEFVLQQQALDMSFDEAKKALGLIKKE